MLRRPDDTLFATGRAGYLDTDPGAPAQSARINISVEFDGLPVLALVDTGAVWSIIDRDVAEQLGLHDREGEEITIHSRLGRTAGKLVRVATTLIAEEGDSVALEATVFVSRDWTAGTFVGYSGLLERVTFGVEPSTRMIYYGAQA